MSMQTGKPIRLERVENDESHQLIEEFMLAANEAVAARAEDVARSRRFTASMKIPIRKSSRNIVSLS